jgi:GT2 family glycosyltransferase
MRELVKRFSEGHIFIWGGMAFPENGYWTLSDNISWFYTSHLSLGEGEYAKTWPPTANMGISKSLVERVGGFDMTLPCGEDIDLAIKLNSLGQNPYFVPTACVYHYHPRAGFKDLIRHASLWGRDSIIMRKRFRKILSTPLVLRSRILLFIFAPFISWWVTFKIFLRVRALRKFLYTFPAVYISKIAWCYAGWRALRYEG